LDEDGDETPLFAIVPYAGVGDEVVGEVLVREIGDGAEQRKLRSSSNACQASSGRAPPSLWLGSCHIFVVLWVYRSGFTTFDVLNKAHYLVWAQD
jgi:hypothetical protein